MGARPSGPRFSHRAAALVNANHQRRARAPKRRAGRRHTTKHPLSTYMKRLRHVAWCALAAIALAHGTLSAQETPAAPAAPAPAATEPAAPPPPAPAPAAPAAKAAEPAPAAPAEEKKADKPTPTLEQRVSMIEAYFGNTDP